MSIYDSLFICHNIYLHPALETTVPPQPKLLTENLILCDFDEVLFKAEGNDGYFHAWLERLAGEFPQQLADHNVSGAEGLDRTYYNYKQQQQDNFNGAMTYQELDDAWRKDLRKQGKQPSQFDPVNFFRETLQIGETDFRRWLGKLEITSHDEASHGAPSLAEGYLHKGAANLWTRIQQEQNDSPGRVQGLIYTQGGTEYQLHKIKAALGKDAANWAQVIASGRKGKHIADSYHEDVELYMWQTLGRLIIADRVALIDDNESHHENLPRIASALGILVSSREITIEKEMRPQLLRVDRTSQIVPVLQKYSYLLAA